MAEIQLDDFSPVAEAVLPMLLLLADNSAQATKAYAALKTWDYQMNKNAIAPTMFETLLTKLMVTLVEDEVKNREVLNALLDAPAFSEFFVSLFKHNASAEAARKRWCDDIRTERKEQCEEVVSRLFREMEETSWSKWGNAHELQLAHNPFSRSRWRFFFHKAVSTGGAPDAVHAVDFRRGEGFGAISSPNIRLVIDLGNRDASAWSLETVRSTQGESGNIFSAHYGDMSETFHSGGLQQWVFGREPAGKKTTLEVANRVN